MVWQNRAEESPPTHPPYSATNPHHSKITKPAAGTVSWTACRSPRVWTVSVCPIWAASDGVQAGKAPLGRQRTGIQVDPGRAGLIGIGVDRQEQILVVEAARPGHDRPHPATQHGGSRNSAHHRRCHAGTGGRGAGRSSACAGPRFWPAPGKPAASSLKKWRWRERKAPNSPPNMASRIYRSLSPSPSNPCSEP